ncbi:MAG: acyl-CoA reductase-like NAD-dependent aldehyde dehydrogenase, partial [Candidatus Paceibacteria bacterium]
LSGQRNGQVARVFCHERVLSKFTEALLWELDCAQGDAGCVRFSAGLALHLEKHLRLGLDEGATLLRGPDGAGMGFRDSKRKGSLAPSVFTNAEPTMGLVRATRPAPLLSILRVTSDAEALAARDRADEPGRLPATSY